MPDLDATGGGADIVITHRPPKGSPDKAVAGEYVGWKIPHIANGFTHKWFYATTIIYSSWKPFERQLQVYIHVTTLSAKHFLKNRLLQLQIREAYAIWPRLPLLAKHLLHSKRGGRYGGIIGWETSRGCPMK